MCNLSFKQKFTLHPSELFSAGASPRISLEELTTLPTPPRRKFCGGRYTFNFCPPRGGQIFALPGGCKKKISGLRPDNFAPPSPKTLGRHWEQVHDQVLGVHAPPVKKPCSEKI